MHRNPGTYSVVLAVVMGQAVQSGCSSAESAPSTSVFGPPGTWPAPHTGSGEAARAELPPATAASSASPTPGAPATAEEPPAPEAGTPPPPRTTAGVPPRPGAGGPRRAEKDPSCVSTKKLTKAEVGGRISAAKRRFAACPGRGTVTSVITISCTGAVSSVVVKSPHDESATGTCLAGIFRTLRFPENDGSTPPVTLPIVLRPDE